MDTVNQDVKDCHRCLVMIDEQLKCRKFLTGETLTLADIPVGAVMYRLTSMGLDVALPKHVAAWYERLQARAAYQKAIMQDFSELKGRTTF